MAKVSFHFNTYLQAANWEKSTLKSKKRVPALPCEKCGVVLGPKKDQHKFICVNAGSVGRVKKTTTCPDCLQEVWFLDAHKNLGQCVVIKPEERWDFDYVNRD